MAYLIEPPVRPMLAKLTREVPRGPQWLYEPKWDGFRAIVFRDGDDIHVQSRDLKPLERYFPELPPLLAKFLPECCVLDGEVVVTGSKGLDFDDLQQRIHPAESRINMLAEKTPASFVAFDVLANSDGDMRSTPLEERRAWLVKTLKDKGSVPKSKRQSQFSVTPQTGDPDEATDWLTTYDKLGLDGVVAKERNSTYVENKRTMIKVKTQKTADCVVGGYRLSKTGDGIGSLLLGLYDDAGVLHFVGHTSSFKAAERRELLKRLKPMEGEESFGHGRTPGGPSRWNSGKELNWVSVRPELVCEVSYDRMQSNRFRHASTFIRWREDKPPKECTMDQVALG
ncbi:MAG: ATP-dependent DNA ligase [Actinomycetota bacterium]|nr:ATP-dependent DNA ligase [Actinomycetota bacterium]